MTYCKICTNSMREIFVKKILNKYDVVYYQCNACNFIQTETPYWLEEAYASAITSQDIGLLYRNNLYAPIVSILIKKFYAKSSFFLDYGGGYGVFVRLMRDRGFNFFRYDSFCENLFARSFDDDKIRTYDFITCLEVFEHLENPIEEVEKMLSKSKTIFFTTEIQPPNLNIEKDWWYIMPETGQHISLYSEKSLEYIAKKFNLNFYSNGKTFHLLTDKKINKFVFKIITKLKVAIFLNLIFNKHTSLLASDYYAIKK